MSVYKAPSVRDEPYVEVDCWMVLELSNLDKHLICKSLTSPYEGRVTSKIIHWNSLDRVITTRSGRKYHLNGDPRWNHDTMYVWSIWCSTYKINQYDCVDVSNDYKQK